ncbi:methyltransferase [Candidatus Aerophobetes bacterium]|uniref:Methyltransferase n=1 Tax=Aerophobetes bacterium TaxID=2030807 RepID=A0A497E625_UNCAE|nr:MAG: methyltransferase [Candidatus Aerophobetes bacterium]
MSPRERVRKAISHQEADRIPVDLGSTLVTGIQASTYAKLRRALGLKDEPVKIADPFQMLSYVEMEVIERLGIDTIGLWLPTTIFGFKREGWKPWRLFDGTKVMVPEKFNTTTDEKGNIYLYPEGDTSAPPSGKMPQGGYYFDVIVRQEAIDEEKLDPEEWVRQQYSVFSEEELKYLERTADALYKNTELSIVGEFVDAGFGDIALVPAPMVRYPKGIRDPQRWIMAHLEHPEYIKGIFELQCEIALKNLELSYEAVGDKIDVIMVSGTDFGTQSGPFISPDMYREIYKPFHKRINDWIHKNTSWKTFYHSCGSIVAFLDDFVEAGVDILNPVQTSAKDMDPKMLKERYGDKLVFWGGGVDTQRTLPFGSPEEVRRQVSERCRIFGKGGGYVFSAIHNIQQKVPIENLMAMFEAVREFRY